MFRFFAVSMVLLGMISCESTGSTEIWERIDVSNYSARANHSVVWADSVDGMILYGGLSNCGGKPCNNKDGLVFYPGSVNRKWEVLEPPKYPDGRVFYGRAYHTAVWTGSLMIVWGGMHKSDDGRELALGDGAIYNPLTSKWTIIDPILPNTPSPRYLHTAVWANKVSGMIIWGGTVSKEEGELNDGAIYFPDTNSWQKISQINAPSKRARHTSVWGEWNSQVCSSGMIVIGGSVDVRIGGHRYSADNGIYDLSNDKWYKVLSSSGSPAPRHNHRSVWMGQYGCLIFGGFRVDLMNSATNEGWIFSPSKFLVGDHSWKQCSTWNAPSSMEEHSLVWDGKEAMAWGSVSVSSSGQFIGGRYNPELDRWTRMTEVNAPYRRREHTGIWGKWKGSDGSIVEGMIIFGGKTPFLKSFVNDAGIYHLAGN